MGERTHEREGERIANRGRRKARERGTVTQEETRLGVAGAESETAERKSECESYSKKWTGRPPRSRASLVPGMNRAKKSELI